jgi:hypothetical protein
MTRMTRAVWMPVVAVLASLTSIGVLPHPAQAAIGPPAVIDNGVIELGIQPEGNLIVGGRGLAFLPTGHESLAPGCDCEGWGVADVGSGISGYASESNGEDNVSVVDFTATDSTATSVVSVPAAPAAAAGGAGTATFRVTHTFTPAAETELLYRLNVNIENTSAIGATDLRYRRVMDWDVEPTPFEEFVTNEPGNAVNIIRLTNDGFFTPDPLVPNTEEDNDVDPFVEGRTNDLGPADHGSLWDFGFGPLAAGASKSFTIFYGAAPSEVAAFDALEAVGAEAFSLGQANTNGLPTISDSDKTAARQGATAGNVGAANQVDGTPTTFIFAFEGVGGTPVFGGSQYVMVANDGGVFAPGGQGFHGTAAVRPGEGILRDARGRIIGASGSPLDSPVVDFAYTPTRQGYWLVQANGGVIPIGDAPDVGSLLGVPLASPIVGAAATLDGTGLYLVASDGGIFALGSAPFKGSLGGTRLNQPIVNMALDHDGSGYLLVASDGGVFTYEADFRGSLGSTVLNKPIVDMAVDADGGYVLAASDGGAFTYGVAFAGSLGSVPLVAPIVGIATDPDGVGYWMAGADGGAFAFGAQFFGSVAPVLLNAPMTGIAAL